MNFLIKMIVALSKFFNLPKRNYNISKNRFLIVSPVGIGDTLWATPAIRALKETYPEGYIGVLVKKTGEEILKGNPHIDDIFVFKEGIVGFFLLPYLLMSLRQKNFDVVLMFHVWDRIIWLLCYFINAGEILGFKGTRGKRFDFILTKAITVPNNIAHYIEKYLCLVKELKASTSNKYMDIYLSDDDRKTIRSFLQNNNINRGSLTVGLNPGARHVYKCWNRDNFIKIGKSLAEKFGCKIVVTGSGKEKALVGEIVSKIRNSINVAGVLTIRETAALIEGLDALITNDTGSLHIAIALRTPTVALFSPTNPQSCGPYNCNTTSVIVKPIVCEPCIGNQCYTPVCMEQITIEEVLAEAEALLKKNYV